MPRLSIHPAPKKRYHGGRWRIYWKWNAKQFSVAANHLDQKKRALVDIDLRLFSAALAMEHPVFPEAYQNAPAVVRFNAGVIVINKSKTKTGRIIPLAAKLEALLKSVPENERIGSVVQFTENLDRL